MKRLAFLSVVLISLIVINNLVHSIYDLWQKKEFIARGQRELEFQKKENQELRNKLQVVNRPDFVETEARNKLFLQKQGESRVVLPASTQASSSGQISILDQVPNWEKWLKLFWD